MKRLLALAVACLPMYVGSIGCESKFVESSPESVKITGLSLNERISQKSKVDSRIEEIQQGAEQIKSILRLFGDTYENYSKIERPTPLRDVYTPIDFLLDLNSELKNKIPENFEGTLVRRGTVRLPIKELSADCQVVELLLESQVIPPSSVLSEPGLPAERLTYSIRTCGSRGQYLSAIEADWEGSTLELRLMTKNLKTIFQDLFDGSGFAEKFAETKCEITPDEKKIIDSIHCEDFPIKLSSSEQALVNNIDFSNSGPMRFDFNADIFENGAKKSYIKIRVPKKGSIEVETPSK